MDTLTSRPLVSDLPDIAADILSRVRGKSPRVHCLTNAVAQNFTANVLLAAGAVPSMTVAPDEIAQFVARADALLINLGTLDGERRQAATTAVEAAITEQRPWVLDPVFVDRSRQRAEFAGRMMAMRPQVVRLNGVEFAAIAQAEPAQDALDRYARDQCCVVALTGATDAVTDGEHKLKIENGAALMGQVTAMGCAGSALVCAALAVEADAMVATVAALAAFGVAGELAARDARGPGSFAFAIIDALHNLDGADLRTRLKVS